MSREMSPLSGTLRAGILRVRSQGLVLCCEMYFPCGFGKVSKESDF